VGKGTQVDILSPHEASTHCRAVNFRVNKAEKMGHRGFGVVAKAIVSENVADQITPTPSPISVPVSFLSWQLPLRWKLRRKSNRVPLLKAAAVPHTSKFTDLASFSMSEPPMIKKPEPVVHVTAQVTAPSSGGFAKVAPKGPPKVCPVDPAERALCDSCA
jgi:hypothetical protein